MLAGAPVTELPPALAGAPVTEPPPALAGAPVTEVAPAERAVRGAGEAHVAVTAWSLGTD